MDSLNVDWTDMEALWERIMNFEMELESEDIVVSCTISPFGKKDYSLDLCAVLHVYLACQLSTATELLCCTCA